MRRSSAHSPPLTITFIRMHHISISLLFFFNDTATTEIYTLSLHDALPIWPAPSASRSPPSATSRRRGSWPRPDRKSTRLNSSHSQISYAVFCLKKKKTVVTVSADVHIALIEDRLLIRVCIYVIVASPSVDA